MVFAGIVNAGTGCQQQRDEGVVAMPLGRLLLCSRCAVRLGVQA
jgi:hypothetical protein